MQGLDVIERYPDKTIHHGAKALLDFFVARGAQGGNGAAMKSLVIDHDLGQVNSFVMAELARQFDGRFVGLQA